MDLKTIIVVILSASLAAFFLPTPVEMQSHFKSGQDFYASRNYTKAIEQFDAIIGTESAFLRSDSVRVQLLNNEIEVGVRTAAYYQKANSLRNLGRKNEAITVLRVVEEREDSPKLSALAQFQIYELLYNDKKYDSAIVEARHLISEYPRNEKVPRAYYDIGWAFREQNRIDSSNTAFRALMNQFPENELDIRSRYQVGQNLFDQQRWDDAIAAYQDLITRYRPEQYAKAEWEGAELKAVRDKKLFEAQEGKDAESSGLELVAKSQIKIADCYQKKGNFEAAIANYRKVIATFTGMPTLVEVTYMKMADYTSQAKGSEAGIQIYRDAIDENFNNKVLQAKLQYKIAKTLHENKLYDRAGSEYLFYCAAYAAQALEIRFPVEQALFIAVSSFYSAKNYPKTITTADTLVVNYPQSEYLSKVLMYKGLALAGQGKYDPAREHYRRVLALAPGTNEAVFAQTQLGKSYFDEKNFDQAIASFEVLLKEDPEKIDASELHYLLGLSYYSTAKYDTCVYHMQKVEPTSSYYPFTFARVTRAYANQQRYADAEGFLNRSFAIAKRDTIDHTAFVRLARSELFSSQQKYELALADFDTVLTIRNLSENTRTQALYGRGLVNFELAKYKECAADIEPCLKSAVFQQVFPALVPQAKEKLAFSYISLNRKKEGVALINELVAASPGDLERSRYLATLCEFYYRASEFDKAIETGRSVLALKQRDDQALIRTYVNMSNAYGNLQQSKKAIELLREAGDRFPTNAFIDETFYQLGMIYLNGGDYASAGDAFKGHMQRFPKSKSYEGSYFGYALSLYQTGLIEEALKSFREFLRLFPQSKRAPEVQVQIGEAYFNTSRFEEAAREYQIVYTRYPANDNAPLALFNEGWCEYQLKRNDRMLAIFRALVDRFPKAKQAADAQFAIGDYYYNQKVYDSALVSYRDFVALFPEDARRDEAAQLVKELGQVEAFKAYESGMAYFEAKNWKLAIQELTNVMQKFPGTDVEFGCKANIASAYAQLGERATALRMFNEIIEQWKTNDAARPAVTFAELHKRWLEAGK